MNQTIYCKCTIALVSLDCRTVLTAMWSKCPAKNSSSTSSYPKEQIFCQGLAEGVAHGAGGGAWGPPLCLSELPNEVLLNVFPFKVVFHVQTAMHAIAKYCSSVSKKETILWINSCYICCPSASLFFGLFFIMWLFPSSHFPLPPSLPLSAWWSPL